MMPYDSKSYADVHRARFEQSIEWLRARVQANTVALELGGHGAFTPMIAPLVGMLEATDTDLREPLPQPSNRYDLVLCMEVLEHINDRDTHGTVVTEWQGTGAVTLLSEIARVLKPDGLLFLTTPNAASITAIHHALRLAPPMIYRPHVREYAPYELDELVRTTGFVIERRETLDVWRNAISQGAHRRIAQFLRTAGYPTDLRGEDIFLLARKPSLDTRKVTQHQE